MTTIQSKSSLRRSQLMGVNIGLLTIGVVLALIVAFGSAA